MNPDYEIKLNKSKIGKIHKELFVYKNQNAVSVYRNNINRYKLSLRINNTLSKFKIANNEIRKQIERLLEVGMPK